MKVGFTATQRGMTSAQMCSVTDLLLEWKPSAFIHGGCVGGDNEGDLLACALLIPRFIFPGHIPHKRVPDEVFKARNMCPVTIMEPKNTLVRNKDIVRASRRLIACPGEDHEVIRSGTWMTIRQGWRTLKRENVWLVLPDGRTVRWL